MDIESTYTFFSSLNEDNISFMYQGSFSDEINDKAIQINDKNFDLQKDPANLKKGVSLLMAECLHNVIKQGETPNTTNKLITKPGVFLTRNIGDSFSTTSAYLIENKSIDSIKKKLEQIIAEDKESLYAMFSEILAAEGVPARKGLLQNIIEMARKSGTKLEYDFDSAGNNWSYLYLQTIISGVTLSNGIQSQYNLNIATAKDFHRKMKDKNIFIIYKGEFSQKSVINILRILEKNLQQSQFENLSEKKIMFHIITEMLQNISKHSMAVGDQKKGIFLVGKNVKGFFISTGNFINTEHARLLKDQINQINSLNFEERNNLYRVILKTGVLTGNGGAGLGLIDIARETKNKFVYNFSETNNNLTFFSLGINY